MKRIIRPLIYLVVVLITVWMINKIFPSSPECDSPNQCPIKDPIN